MITASKVHRVHAWVGKQAVQLTGGVLTLAKLGCGDIRDEFDIGMIGGIYDAGFSGSVVEPLRKIRQPTSPQM